MIVGMWSYNDNSDLKFQTDGCGCCSDTLSSIDDYKAIVDGLKQNLIETKKYCDAVDGISFEALVKTILDNQ